jgi:hypothetical protein
MFSYIIAERKKVNVVVMQVSELFFSHPLYTGLCGMEVWAVDLRATG